MPASRKPGKKKKYLRLEIRIPSLEWLDSLTRASLAAGASSVSEYARLMLEKAAEQDDPKRKKT